MKWTLVFMVLGLLPLCNSVQAFDQCSDTIVHRPRPDIEFHPYPAEPPEKIKVPVTIDLIERYGLDVPDGLELDAEYGDIEIDERNHIFYNGQDITSDIKDTCDNEPSQFETIIEQQTTDGNNTDARRKLP